MRPRLLLASLAVLFLATFPAAARALAEISVREAPKADPRLLRALTRGPQDAVRVIVGVRDGTPSARALLVSPDLGGEPARRVRRLAAQRRLAEEIPEEQFEPLHYYRASR